MIIEALFISDVHLGCKYSKAEELLNKTNSRVRIICEYIIETKF